MFHFCHLLASSPTALLRTCCGTKLLCVVFAAVFAQTHNTKHDSGQTSLLRDRNYPDQKLNMSSHNIASASNITKQEDQTYCNITRRDHATHAQTQSVSNTFPVWGINTAASLLSGLPKPLPNYSNDSRRDRRNDIFAQIDQIKEAVSHLVGWRTKAAPASSNSIKSDISSNFSEAGPPLVDCPCGISGFDSNKELPDAYIPCPIVYVNSTHAPSFYI